MAKISKNTEAQTSELENMNMNKGKGNRGNKPKQGKFPKGGGNRRPFPNNKTSRQAKEIADTALDMAKGNPYSWYANNPQFTRDAGTIPFGIPLGQSFNIQIRNNETNQVDQFTIPGIYQICYYPAIGYSADLMSPINRSALRFYTFLRTVMKSAQKYEVADVMFYLLAIDSMHSFHAWMKRLYGIAQLYTPLNKYYPIKLLNAAGGHESLLNNLAEFRAYINRFGLSLGQFCMPKDFDITQRHMWMNEGVYLDSNTTRAQTYIFRPEGFWIFDNTVVTGSRLAWKPLGNSSLSRLKLSEIMEFGDSLLNSVINDQDTGNISGDLYNLYGPSRLMSVGEVTDLYAILPTYQETVLSQIENAVPVGDIYDPATFEISQDPSINSGAIIFKPQFLGNKQSLDGTGHPVDVGGLRWNPTFQMDRSFINMHVDSPSPEDVIEATRLVVACDPPISELRPGQALEPNIFGSDIVSRFRIYDMREDLTDSDSTLSFAKNYIMIGQDMRTEPIQSWGLTDHNLKWLTWGGAFSRHPMIHYIKLIVNQGDKPEDVILTIDDVGIHGDLDNITMITASQLRMMHEASMLSLFDVPGMGQ